jgi:cyclophilin family peptidyl-prolyl cis-trans isomerase
VASQKRERKREGQAARRAALEAARKRQERRKRFGLGAGLVAGVIVLALLFTWIFGSSDRKTPVASTTTTSVTAGPTDSSTTAPGTTDSTAAATRPIPPVPAGRAIKGETPCPKADGSEARASSFEKAPPMCIDPKKAYTAVFETTAGTVRVKLDTAKTPQTTNNFVVLSRYHYYDGSSFQRTDPSIDIIQGGSPNTQTIQDPGPGYTIKDEPTFTGSGAEMKGPYTYTDGDLVMARSQGPDSAAAQYFFSAGSKTAALSSQGTYVVFGHASEGLDVLEKVLASHKACPAGAQACLGGAPSPPVAVTKITIEEA